MEAAVVYLFFIAIVVAIVIVVRECIRIKGDYLDRAEKYQAFEASIRPGVNLIQKMECQPPDPFVGWYPCKLKVIETRRNKAGNLYALVFDGLSNKSIMVATLYEEYELL